jgi:isopenicillin N synthase-like dioxygenase
MSGIPIVDFGAFLHGKAEDQDKIAKEIDDAFRSMGFVYLKNHGVRKELLEECFAWSKKFFDLPLETKMLAPHPPGGSHHRGYSAPGVEKVSQGVYDINELNKLREVSCIHLRSPWYKLMRGRRLIIKSPSSLVT